MKKIQVQEVWFAEFPFEEDPGKSKNRPVIVLDVDDETCTVLSMKITSRKPYGDLRLKYLIGLKFR